MLIFKRKGTAIELAIEMW